MYFLYFLVNIYKGRLKYVWIRVIRVVYKNVKMNKDCFVISSLCKLSVSVKDYSWWNCYG